MKSDGNKTVNCSDSLACRLATHLCRQAHHHIEFQYNYGCYGCIVWRVCQHTAWDNHTVGSSVHSISCASLAPLQKIPSEHHDLRVCSVHQSDVYYLCRGIQPSEG